MILQGIFITKINFPFKKASDILGPQMQKNTDKCHRLGEKDFLFECLMHRFDLLLSSKIYLKNIYHDIPSNPCLAHLQLQLLKKNFTHALEPRYGRFCMPHLLTGLYITLLPVWFEDIDTDMSKTMAHLDRSLSVLLSLKNRFRVNLL